LVYKITAQVPFEWNPYDELLKNRKKVVGSKKQITQKQRICSSSQYEEKTEEVFCIPLLPFQ
jgi:hypothetical protein